MHALHSDAVTLNKPLCMPVGIYDRDTVLRNTTDGEVLPVATYIVQVILGEYEVPYLCGISLHGFQNRIKTIEDLDWLALT
jgi:hypothetical protein